MPNETRNAWWSPCSKARSASGRSAIPPPYRNTRNITVFGNATQHERKGDGDAQHLAGVGDHGVDARGDPGGDQPAARERRPSGWTTRLREAPEPPGREYRSGRAALRAVRA